MIELTAEERHAAANGLWMATIKAVRERTGATLEDVLACMRAAVPEAGAWVPYGTLYVRLTRRHAVLRRCMKQEVLHEWRWNEDDVNALDVIKTHAYCILQQREDVQTVRVDVVEEDEATLERAEKRHAKLVAKNEARTSQGVQSTSAWGRRGRVVRKGDTL